MCIRPGPEIQGGLPTAGSADTLYGEWVLGHPAGDPTTVAAGASAQCG